MWYKEDNAQKGITVSSRIRLARNLSDLPFSSRMSQNDMSVLKERVKSALKEIEESGGIALKYIECDDIPEQELAAMVERHIISPDFARNNRGRAVAISEDESISEFRSSFLATILTRPTTLPTVLTLLLTKGSDLPITIPLATSQNVLPISEQDFVLRLCFICPFVKAEEK